MGMYNPKAPAPDPNIGISQKEMSDLAREESLFFRENFAPRYLTQMDDQIALGRQQVQDARDMQDFQTGLMRKYDTAYWKEQAPFESAMMADAAAYDTEGKRAELAGLAKADVNQAFGQSRAATERGLARRGVNYRSGAGLNMVGDVTTAHALALAGAGNRVRTTADDIGWARRGEAAALKRGLPGFSAGSAGLSMNAGQGGLAASNAAMSAIGAAQGGFNANSASVGGMWNRVGQLGVGRYGADVQAYNAAAANNPMNAILGAATGVGMSYGLKRWG